MAQKSPPPSLPELNRRADLLAARARLFFNGSAQSSLSASDSVNHRPLDLEEECRMITSKIKQLQDACSGFPELPVMDDEELPLGLLMKERRLRAELDVWKKQRPSVFCTDPSVIEEDAKQQVTEWGEELQSTLKVVREERGSLAKELEREKRLLEETRLIKEALLEKQEELIKHKTSDQQPASTCVLEERLKKVEEHCSVLKESLKVFVGEHLIESSEEVLAATKPKRTRQQHIDKDRHTDSDTIAYPDLFNLIQTLISKCLDTPEDAYISSETVWPPHLQLLLRSFVIEHHPDNPTLIRITPYHLK